MASTRPCLQRQLGYSPNQCEIKLSGGDGVGGDPIIKSPAHSANNTTGPVVGVHVKLRGMGTEGYVTNIPLVIHVDGYQCSSDHD